MENTEIFMPNENVLVIHAGPNHDQVVMTIFSDGRIDVGSFATPSDAAKAVIGALADLLPQYIRRPEGA